MQQSTTMPGITYHECLKNHAASIGSNVFDGCGEFMPSSHDGTLKALKCAACSCHRNFHRKEHHDEVEMVRPMAIVFSGNGMESSSVEQLATKKRHRTKFTVEQKERMLEFAEKIGWRIPRAMEDEAEVQSFCGEVRVNLHVLKVWMHNNKKPQQPQQENQM